MKIALVLLILLLTMAADAKEMNAGKATIDLGDGYKASFVLPDIGKPYQIEDAYAGSTADNPLAKLYKPYGILISSDGTDLAQLTVFVYTSPQFEYIPEAGMEKSAVPDAMGPRLMQPTTISGAPGFVGHDLQVGATGPDTSNAMTAFFKCFPGAFRESGDLKSMIEVSGEAQGFPASPEALQVVHSMVDSLKISGPGI